MSHVCAVTTMLCSGQRPWNQIRQKQPMLPFLFQLKPRKMITEKVAHHHPTPLGLTLTTGCSKNEGYTKCNSFCGLGFHLGLLAPSLQDMFGMRARNLREWQMKRSDNCQTFLISRAKHSPDRNFQQLNTLGLSICASPLKLGST